LDRVGRRPQAAPFQAAYTVEVIRAIFSAVWFWWRGCKGYRLTPWRSPYLRWRMETYSGKPAATLKLSDFWALAVAERGQLGNYLRWVGELRGLAQGQDPS
jgi:hypothetical protein